MQNLMRPNLTAADDDDDGAGAHATAPWPVEALDPLAAHTALDPRARLQRAAAHFPVLEAPRGHKRSLDLMIDHADATADQGGALDGVVENEPGLCARMEQELAALQRRVRSGELLLVAPWRQRGGGDGAALAPTPPRVPPLAALVHSQRVAFPFVRWDVASSSTSSASASAAACNGDAAGGAAAASEAVADEEAAVSEAILAPPLLLSALVCNGASRQAVLRASGARWVLPPRSAFALLPLTRWATDLPATAPMGGYRLVLMDPPWHCRSAARKGAYATLDRRVLLEQLSSALPRLLSPSGALIAVWVTNSHRVQAFVEEVLFPRLGARCIGRWYWMKLAASAEWASAAASPRSPHRKPWEALLLGSTTDAAAPPLPLPRRLAIASMPTAHSAKPPLDALLTPAAATLLGRRHPPVRAAAPLAATEADAADTTDTKGSATEATAGGDAAATADEAAAASGDAWRALPKLELFARELRPHWHAVGDEVLHFQHMGWYSEAGGGT